MRKTIDDLLAMCDSRYVLVDAISRKARKIADEAEIRGLSLTDKPVNIVLNSLFDGNAEIKNKGEDEMEIVFADGFNIFDKAVIEK
ncbi:MAG: DNA-directed RNA polymerase subunit omega [Oscillospiraceae bacterium]|jgi:DNA-directed RNA polymerase subunit K/omega|nr:DNA-directed RNA polymerase subunit omega [Oscillospiraceae bacterium]